MVAHIGLVEVAMAQAMRSEQYRRISFEPFEAKISVTLLLRGKLGWTLASVLSLGPT